MERLHQGFKMGDVSKSVTVRWCKITSICVMFPVWVTSQKKYPKNQLKSNNLMFVDAGNLVHAAALLTKCCVKAHINKKTHGGRYEGSDVDNVWDREQIGLREKGGSLH